MAFLIVQIFGDIFKDDNAGIADCQSAVSIVFGDNTSGRGKGLSGGRFQAVDSRLQRKLLRADSSSSKISMIFGIPQ
jgi:hypothetical protein